MNATVLIPAYQPDQKLVTLVKELTPHCKVIVVDDGSSAACAPFFDQAGTAGAVVLRHKRNLGKGAALKTGIAYLMKTTCELGAVTADADGQHSVADILRVGEAMEAHPGAVILGGRDFSKMPPRSRAGNTITRFAFRLTSGLSVSDTQTGLRGLPASLFGQLAELDGERYEYEMNMLLALRSWKVEAVEIPIETIYEEGNKSSHFHALRDGLRVFSRVLRYVLSSIVATAADYLFYCLFNLFLHPAWSYAAARVVSGVLNYEMNRRMVFKARSTAGNAIGYTLLTLFSTSVGSLAVTHFIKIGLHEITAKLIIDLAMFFFNYFMQKYVIFRPKKREA